VGLGLVEGRGCQILDAFFEAGATSSTRERLYNGTSENFPRRILQGRPSRRPGDQVHQHEGRHRPNAGGTSGKSMMQAVEASLKRLKTDYIDLYWSTRDQMTPIDEVERGFDDLVRQGKILYAGVSDMPPGGRPRQPLASCGSWTSSSPSIEYSLIDGPSSASCCRWRSRSDRRHGLVSAGGRDLDR